MPEKDKIVSGKKISYQGLFNMEELFHNIEKKLSNMGYLKVESANVEQVLESGTEFDIVLTPIKSLNRYARLEFRIDITGNKIKKVDVEIDEEKHEMNKGTVTFVIDGFLITDYSEHWTNSPIYFLLKVLFDRFIYPGQFSKYELEMKEDSESLIRELKSFLNLGKYIN